MAISFDDALVAVLAEVTPLGAEVVATDAAAGRITAEDIVSTISLPSFANSAMDGFALRAADTHGADGERPVRLRVVGESRAGVPATGRLEPGCAARVSTGAALPDGADAVVRVEDTADAGGDQVAILVQVSAGHDVRPVGDDIATGEVVVPAGSPIGAAERAMMGAIGLTEVPVGRTPTLAVLTTGDELVPPGMPLQPGQIYESNSAMLAALAVEAGARVTSVRGDVGDTFAATRDAIAAALAEVDVLVLSGGVSMGAHDHVKPALDALGATCRFWRVALRPGHPTWFGTLVVNGRKRLIFALPGNPVSAYVTFQLLAVPALARMLGAARRPLEFQATFAGPTQRKPPEATMALRCRVEGVRGDVLAILTGPNQRSHAISSLIGADGLALVPPGRDRVQDGDRVVVRLLR